jgi:Recombinase
MNGPDQRPTRRRGRPPRCPREIAARILTLNEDQGLSRQQIADLLNAEGVPTPLGLAPWSKSHVDGVLSRLYTREIQAERSTDVFMLTKRKRNFCLHSL